MNSTNIHFDSEYIIEGTKLEIDYNVIKEYLTNIINSLTDINLNFLTDIYFPSNYEQALFVFQRENGHHEKYTDNEYGKGFGMAIEYIDSQNKIKSVIFYHPAVLIGLYGICIGKEYMSEEQVKLILNVIYHELFHIHDFNFFQDLVDNNKNNDITNIEISYCIWSEYFAHRKTGMLFSIKTDNDISPDDLEKLFLSMKEDSNNEEIFSMVGRVIGDIHALDKRLIEFIDEKLTYPFDEIEKLLDLLFKQYPNWNGIDEFVNLAFLTKQ
ncbi:hypothetical protein ACFDTO_13410 [Microbacteriaceae bacterium 4G12]